jgi:insertion element IS1 protein InsB
LIRLRRDAVEMDELCISKRRGLWLWTAVSRYTGQILAWLIGSREWHHLARLWERVPKPWRKRLVYTDGYGAYSAFFASWQHRLCEKGDGGTATVEGVNQSLRHRCGPLVRRTSAKCRSRAWLDCRLSCAVMAHNRGGQRRLNRRIKVALAKRSESTQGRR